MIRLKLSSIKRKPENVSYQAYILPSLKQSDLTYLVIAFEGKYGIGSAGNWDAGFMEEVSRAALEAFPIVNAVIYDLTKLSYHWGDMLTQVFRGDINVIIISDLNRSGMTSLVEREIGGQTAEILFEGLEAAINYLEKGFEVGKFVYHYLSGRAEKFVEAGRVNLVQHYNNDNFLWLEDWFYPTEHIRKMYDQQTDG